MDQLRRATFLVRLVLAWFVLSIGAAVASPVIKPQAVELICTGSGAIKALVKTDDGVKELSSHTLECPLCMVTGTLPPWASQLPEPAHPLSHVLRPIPAAHIAWLTAAPLPARGPPSHS